ncbi:MAG: family 16 glycosylhydrolase [Acidobacteria bacterium]|nr:family 16 glycosylhydrolase [Acidobacteriota bacterium]
MNVIVTSSGLIGTATEVATDPAVLDATICACPLAAVTHVVAPGLSDSLAANNPGSLCASNNYWNQSVFGNGWLSDPTHFSFPSGSSLTLTLNDRDATGAPCDPVTTNCSAQSFASAEYKTFCYHGYGTYTATITPPQQPSSGTVTGFFTYTDGNDGTVGANNTAWHDEIDIELLGRAPQPGDSAAFGSCAGTPLIVQANYFVKGVGNHEKAFCLPFGTYTYSFAWTAGSIVWSFSDSNGSHVLHQVDCMTTPCPTQPGRVFMNLWANTTGDAWVGPFTYNGPWSAVFANVSAP